MTLKLILAASTLFSTISFATNGTNTSNASIPVRITANIEKPVQELVISTTPPISGIFPTVVSELFLDHGLVENTTGKTYTHSIPFYLSHANAYFNEFSAYTGVSIKIGNGPYVSPLANYNGEMQLITSTDTLILSNTSTSGIYHSVLSATLETGSGYYDGKGYVEGSLTSVLQIINAERSDDGQTIDAVAPLLLYVNW